MYVAKSLRLESGRQVAPVDLDCNPFKPPCLPIHAIWVAPLIDGFGGIVKRFEVGPVARDHPKSYPPQLFALHCQRQMHHSLLLKLTKDWSATTLPVDPDVRNHINDDERATCPISDHSLTRASATSSNKRYPNTSAVLISK